MPKTLRTEESIFAEALDKSCAEERAAFLDGVCGTDAGFRARVESLIRSHEQAGSFLRKAPAATMDEPAHERPGALIGPYKLLQQIGEGGMGIVYMAEQEQPIRRRVALKIIKPGMDSAQVISRFEAERQALALMDHPNIARVLDAGTTEGGRPYFVMELVHGVPITKYCDNNKHTPRQRLDLFIAVCQAIQHAHQKGIIHRDIKASNVMVTLHDGRPVPKVIDFGVAKATEQRLTERTLFTQYGTIVGTLEYMAPEQAEMSGLGVDTRSDIYSLGVLLYELLTGTTPLERGRLREAAYDEMLRLIREEEAPRPSQRISTSGDRLAAISAERNTEPARLSRLLRGELDWIVMKALEKDRTRRYETANDLARDLERYLADEPVEACPPTAGYRLRKFARKHQKLLATAAAFAALLLLGVAGSAWQAVRATEAEAEALANEQQANANAVQAQKNEQEANQQRDEVQGLNEKLRAIQTQLERTLYAAHMNLAQHAWNAGGVERVTELLEQHRPKAMASDLRGFEWHYLYKLSHSELLTLKGHTGDVRAVAYSSDGNRLASASLDNTVKLWDAQTGQELLTLRHTGPVMSMALSPDGRRLAAGGGTSFDMSVKVWDLETGQEINSLPQKAGSILGVAFSPDGKRLASTAPAGNTGQLKVWDALTGRELFSFKGRGGPVRFSPDGKRLATGVWGDKTVMLCDSETGQELLSLQGLTGQAWGLAFSPDGKRLAAVSTLDKTVKVWDAQSGKELVTLKGGNRSVAFSSDGKRLASPSDGNMVKVWDAQTGQELLALKGLTGPVSSVAFSPDGNHVACASGNTVKVLDAQPSRNPLALPLTFPGGGANRMVSLAFSPDGKRLATGSLGLLRGEPVGEAKAWNVQNGRELFTVNTGAVELLNIGGAQSCVAFTSNGKRLASLGPLRGVPRAPERDLKVWDAQTGQELLTITLKGFNNPSVASVVFSPDGKRLASVSGAEAKVWDAQTGKELLALKGHSSEVISVAFSPDGKRLATGSRDDPPSGKAISAEAKVWEVQTGKEVFTFRIEGSLPTPIFSPDGKRLASGSGANAKVWDAQTGEELFTLKGHGAVVTSVVYSPDGKRLVSTALDKTMRLWDAQTGQELFAFEGHGGVMYGVAFSPDGHRLAASAADGTVSIWDATPMP